ncbi:hypothetical protein ACFYVR_01175 [Rhodococcus sp. NPDC003318]|uniref:hypothetical protein n=1 Tax=Rhodococcus sp. NPDC003318 TaxID=3364503 RepID=UPI0036D1A8E8
MGRHRGPHRGPLSGRWGFVACTAAVVACAGVPGGAEGDLSRAAGDSASALSAARLALQQHGGGDTTGNHAVTVVSDAVKEVLGSYDTVAELEVATVDESAHRTVLLDRLADATAVLAAARSHVDGPATAPDAATLDADLAALTGLLAEFADGAR